MLLLQRTICQRKDKGIGTCCICIFEYIENLIRRRNTFNMEQFSESVTKFLSFMDYQILPDKGRISAVQAKDKAEQEYDIFNLTQPIDSDFDKQIRGVLEQGE